MTITTDPNLPSYLHPTYQDLLPYWDFCKDMYRGRSAWLTIDPQTWVRKINPIKAKVYLHQEEEEDGEQYLRRLSASYFERKFGNAIDAFAGLLSNFNIEGELPQWLEDCIDDVDLQGNDLESFFMNADIKALRDHHCFILVDFPIQPVDEVGNKLITNAAEEREYGMRPYFCLIEASQLINWSVSSNQQVLNQATIHEQVWVQDGIYGTKQIERYRVLYPGYFEIYEQIDNELVMTASQTTTLEFIPLIPYTVSTVDRSPYSGLPPLLDLAELNLKLYQLTSEKGELMHKCNIPILQVNEIQAAVGGLPIARQEKPEKVRVGANTVFWNVNASYIEPTGSALSLTIQDINELSQTMAARTLDFLTLGNQTPKTATEVVHSSAPMYANVTGMMKAKESNIQRCFEFWAAYTNNPESTATISIDEGIVQSAMTSRQLTSIMMVRKNREISSRTFLSLIKNGKVLPADFDIEAEITELKAEEDEELAEEMGLIPLNIPTTEMDPSPTT